MRIPALLGCLLLMTVACGGGGTGDLNTVAAAIRTVEDRGADFTMTLTETETGTGVDVRFGEGALCALTFVELAGAAGATSVDEAAVDPPSVPVFFVALAAAFVAAFAATAARVAAALTRSFSSLPTLKKGRRFGFTLTAEPVRGLRPS